MKALINKAKWMVLMLFLPLMGGCEKNEDSPPQNLEFKLVICDEEGVELQSFEEGENFLIGIKLINNSDNTIEVTWSDQTRLLTHFHTKDDFLMVYQVVGEGTGEKQLIPIGKPYDPDVPLNFTTINLSPREIPSGDGILLQGFFWLQNPYKPDNQALVKGNYYSSFSDEVTINGVTVPVNTEITFEVR